MWVLNGFDSTLDGWMRVMNGSSQIAMGDGTHWSTFLNYFLIVFLISVYLERKKIVGFHNVLVSGLVPIVGMMVFEFPWVTLADYSHNNWAITFYGIGGIDIGMLILGLTLLPLCFFYSAFQTAYNHLRIDGDGAAKIAYLSYFGSFLLILGGCLWFGTPTILIRNSMGLFFFIFAHAVLKDATYNPLIISKIGKLTHEIKQRKIFPAILLLFAICLFALWFIFPWNFQVVKGTTFPQTVYGFYEHGTLVETLWVQNDLVHALNVLTKGVITAMVALIMVPKIKYVGGKK